MFPSHLEFWNGNMLRETSPIFKGKENHSGETGRFLTISDKLIRIAYRLNPAWPPEFQRQASALWSLDSVLPHRQER